ncbi:MULTISPECIES: PTS sugar transporter subunit IIA [Methylobacterium]|uniref:PTS sugar transporter subunit IIA n=1 Tax=Methylobacterium TaxID=407 RepID=UPI001FAC5C67|nr:MULTISPECIES: PTS sugar transporter subunit IIA [Methylobacterium]
MVPEKRERLGSAGIRAGIVLPHARREDLERLFGLLAHLRDPIEFEAIDEPPVDLVALLPLPAVPRDDSANGLACIVRRLRDPAVPSAQLAARDAPGLHVAPSRDWCEADG